MVKHIPNLITSLNILCGSVAVLFAVSGDLVSASFFVLFGIFFDFFDGLAARLLDAQSTVGLQLDSLGDVITSGLAPAVIMVQLLSKSVSGDFLRISEVFSEESWSLKSVELLPFIGLLIVVASAYRLAKFNVDTRQTSGFIGLPTPANTLLIVSLPLMLHFQSSEGLKALIFNKWILVGLTVLSCLLLNMEARLFGLKFKNWGLKNNGVRYLFLGVSALLLVLLWFKGIPLIIAVYLLLSIFWKEREEVS